MQNLFPGRNFEKIFRETKKIYDGLPEDVRMDQTSEAFFNAFKSLVDEDFFTARDILVKFREKAKQRNMFLMFTDKEHNAVGPIHPVIHPIGKPRFAQFE